MSSNVNFFILGRGRTGTNFLVESLNLQPDIHSFYELFEISKNFPKEECYYKDRKDNQSPKDYLDNLVFPEKAKHRGFKILSFQFEQLFKNTRYDLFDYISEKNDIKVIISNRRNIFLEYLSNRKAFSVGHYMGKADYKRKIKTGINSYEQNNIKINFNLNLYNHYINNTYRQYLEKIENLEKYGISYIITDYEDRSGENKNEHYARIVKFLTGTEPFEISLDKVNVMKQNVYTLEEQIENFDQVSQALKNDQHFIEAIEICKKEKEKHLERISTL